MTRFDLNVIDVFLNITEVVFNMTKIIINMPDFVPTKTPIFLLALNIKIVLNNFSVNTVTS